MRLTDYQITDIFKLTSEQQCRLNDYLKNNYSFYSPRSFALVCSNSGSVLAYEDGAWFYDYNDKNSITALEVLTQFIKPPIDFHF